MRQDKTGNNLHGVQGVGGSNPLTQILFPQGLMVEFYLTTRPSFSPRTRYMTGNAGIWVLSIIGIYEFKFLPGFELLRKID